MTARRNAGTGIQTIITIIIPMIILISATGASAQEKGVDYGAFVRFAAGVITAFAIHEGAHELVAELTDTDMSWEIGNYNQPLGFTERATSDSRGAAVHSAGLLSQAVGSEIILRSDSIDKNTPFVRGMMAWNIVNPISYALDYWLVHRTNKANGRSYQGDLEGLEHYSSKTTANIFAASLVAIAAFQGYRFLQTQDWAPDWAKNESDASHQLDLQALSSGGLAMTYSYHF